MNNTYFEHDLPLILLTMFAAALVGIAGALLAKSKGRRLLKAWRAPLTRCFQRDGVRVVLFGAALCTAAVGVAIVVKVPAADPIGVRLIAAGFLVLCIAVLVAIAWTIVLCKPVSTDDIVYLTQYASKYPRVAAYLAAVDREGVPLCEWLIHGAQAIIEDEADIDENLVLHTTWQERPTRALCRELISDLTSFPKPNVYEAVARASRAARAEAIHQYRETIARDC